jgi:membrane-bound lytic murein transglycosylase D
LKTRELVRRARSAIPTVVLAGAAVVSSIGISATSTATTSTTKPTQAFAASPVVVTAPRVDASDASIARTDPAPTAGGLSSIDDPRVTKWITRFTTSLRDEFSLNLGRMAKYESMISRKLASRDMPQGLAYLAMIESGFNPSAKSPVKATGMWQFMTATAKRYGLKVGRRVDERKDPAKSTDAALAYLSDLHARFGSWYLAAAAYNAGEGTILRALKTVTGRTTGSDADYYRISAKLPAETRDYVPKLIAAVRVASCPSCRS